MVAQLGEYLEELDQICISFDEGKTTVNFIEAALLIQGSACVYSKKVEYLYSLVYQALDFISDKKQAKQLSSVQEDGSNRAVNLRRTPCETVDEFLPLDDFPDSRANMDLKNDQVSSELLMMPLLPMALVAPDEVEKNTSPLYSCQGEVLASRKDFRMNTCTFNSRGSAMLDPVGMWPYSMSRSQKGTEDAAKQPMEVSRNRSLSPKLGIFQEPDGSKLSGGEEVAEDVAEQPEVALEPAEPMTSKQSAILPTRYMLLERQGALEPTSWLQDTPDPWQILDPFKESSDSKPFKKGITYTLPPGVEGPPGQKHKRKGATELQDFHQWYLDAYVRHTDGRRARQKGPTFADMEELYWKHKKERLKTLQMLQRCKITERWQDLWPTEEDSAGESLGDLGVADDVLEPKEYVEEPEGEMPRETADLHADAMPKFLRYEELVRRNVELFTAVCKKFIQETELSQRLQDWDDKIKPLLQEQVRCATWEL